MKEKIIEVIERLKDTPYKKGDFILTHSWVVQVATEVEHLVNQEVEKRIAETVAGKFIAVEIEKRIADRFPSKEEILKYFNNHFNCYTDVTIRDYETTEIAMTNIAVLKMFEWLRSRLVSQKTECEYYASEGKCLPGCMTDSCKHHPNNR